MSAIRPANVGAYRSVRATVAGPVACAPNHPKARPVLRWHPFAHLFEGDFPIGLDEPPRAALCGFEDFDAFAEVDLSPEVDEDLGVCPVDTERLVCGDCLEALREIDDRSDWLAEERLARIEENGLGGEI